MKLAVGTSQQFTAWMKWEAKDGCYLDRVQHQYRNHRYRLIADFDRCRSRRVAHSIGIAEK